MVDTMRIPAGGGELHAYAYGDPTRADVATATPFLLVHGLASNALLWSGVAQALGARGHVSVAVDLRGHGRSWKPDDGYDFATVGKDLLDVIAHLGWARPVVAGQSWGANVVLDLAAHHGEGLAGVVLVDGGWLQLRRRFPLWEDCEATLAPPPLAGTPVATIRRRIEERLRDWPDGSVDAALACFEVLDDATVRPWLTRERHLAILRELWAHDPAALYPRIEAPVLLVPADDTGGGADDKRALVAEAAGALPRSRTEWFVAHHDVHAQKPDELAALLHGCVVEGFFG